ncbi:MAG TPA: exodeoxyribonuclease III [Candidatus Acidoferrales bacterium]|nr:exodeoxyribonuclease III [Candidatus Acidoferrales bacterium]
MKLISWNVNGIRAAWKKGLPEFVAAQNPDVLCLQETKIQLDQLTPEIKDLPGYRSHWSMAEKKGYSGVVTYTRPEPVAVSTNFGSPALDSEGRVLHIEYPDFHLFNGYFPNSGMGPERLAHKMQFYDEFLTLSERLRKAGKGIVVCGDVNTAHTEMDIARPKENENSPGFMPIEREWVSKLIAHGYHDTFRIFVAEPGHYTWWDMKRGARARNVGWRIDYFFVSDELRGRIKAAGILPTIQGSDHCPITLEIE